MECRAWAVEPHSWGKTLSAEIQALTVSMVFAWSHAWPRLGLILLHNHPLSIYSSFPCCLFIFCIIKIILFTMAGACSCFLETQKPWWYYLESEFLRIWTKSSCRGKQITSTFSLSYCTFVSLFVPQDYEYPNHPQSTQHQKNDRCPPPPQMLPERACEVPGCRSDSECERHKRCCYNGCIYACLESVQPPPGQHLRQTDGYRRRPLSSMLINNTWPRWLPTATPPQQQILQNWLR